MINITAERLKQLEDIEFKMECLESGGVDNWVHYGDSLEEYHKIKDRELALEKIFESVLEALSSGTYEPSERGAGIAFGNDEQDEAMKIMVDGLNEIIKQMIVGSKILD